MDKQPMKPDDLTDHFESISTTSGSEWAECPRDDYDEGEADSAPPFQIEGFTYDVRDRTFKPSQSMTPRTTVPPAYISDPANLTTPPLNLTFRTLRKCHHDHPSPAKDLEYDVGDLIRIVETPGGHWNDVEGVRDAYGIYYLQGVNLRTGLEGRVHWHAFRRVGMREMCPCHLQHCACVYEDYEASLVRPRYGFVC